MDRVGDIVERLRDAAVIVSERWGRESPECLLIREAADEIARLRVAFRDNLRQHAKAYDRNGIHDPRKLDAEIDRVLRGDMPPW